MAAHCWNQIGVEGDRSCKELETFTHCRNCPAYALAGRALLEREVPLDYKLEWTHLLARKADRSGEKEDTAFVAGSIAAVVFRLGEEWLALPCPIFREIAEPTIVRPLPHRSDEVFLGITNLRGSLLPCISLHALLGLTAREASEDTDAGDDRSRSSPTIYKRMVAIEKQGTAWAFAVDEIDGVERFPFEAFQDPPAAIAQETQNYMRALISWQQQKINYLNDDLLFEALERKIL